MSANDTRLLWWNPAEDRWIEADFEAFTRWRGMGELLGLDGGDRNWPMIRGGDHRFVVCVMDDDEATVINFIAHRYTAGPGGEFAGMPSLLDADERRDWDRLYSLTTSTVEDDERLRELQDKEFAVLQIPLRQLEALPRDLPWPVTMQTEYGFWQAYGRHGGKIPDVSRAN